MTRAVPAVATAAIALAAAAACGGDGGDGDSPSAGGPPTRLEITVRPRGPDDPTVRRAVVDCSDGERGSDRCRRLEAASPSAFEPAPRDRICSQVFGGPATAVVRGRLRGRPVTARFELTNGCEISRWERFAWLLGDPPGVSRGPA